MKKDCAYTRKSLKKYLLGHLFKPQKIRIDRHLKSCAVCRSEFEALKQAEETRLYLKDITPAEGVVQRVLEELTGLGRLKKILYRPLWIAGIVLAAAAVSYYVITPRKLDVEIENIVKTAPSSSAPAAAAPSAAADGTAGVSAPPVVAPSDAPRVAAEPARTVEPLTVTVTIEQENEKAAIRRINEIMRRHGRLRKKKFSDEVREISGSLTAKELLDVVKRIEEVGKASYSGGRLDSFPSAQPTPFVMKLKAAPKIAEKSSPSAQPIQRPAEKPVEAAASLPSATTPTPSHAP